MVVTKCSKYEQSKPNQKREDPISRITIPAYAYAKEKEMRASGFALMNLVNS